jgi:hypothetical protein
LQNIEALPEGSKKKEFWEFASKPRPKPTIAGLGAKDGIKNRLASEFLTSPLEGMDGETATAKP